MTSYREKRRRRWELNLGNWPKLLARWRAEHEVVPGNLPESLVTIRLDSALDCLYAGDLEYGSAFLREAISHADGNLRVDNCRATPVAQHAYPRNLGVIIRGRCYAVWLLGGEINRPVLREAAEYITSWALRKAVDHERFRASSTMSLYLDGVRATMLSGDVAFALELLSTRHSFRWHHGVERDLWARLLETYPDVSTGIRTEFEEFFDRVRDPDYRELPDGNVPTFINRHLLALETGMIRQMYFHNQSLDDPLSAQGVIDAVAR